MFSQPASYKDKLGKFLYVVVFMTFLNTKCIVKIFQLRISFKKNYLVVIILATFSYFYSHAFTHLGKKKGSNGIWYFLPCKVVYWDVMLKVLQTQQWNKMHSSSSIFTLTYSKNLKITTKTHQILTSTTNITFLHFLVRLHN